jgi:signal transduction histidine kinase
MSVRLTVIVLLSSVISYLHLYSTIEEGAIQTLEKFVTERSLRESFVFEQAIKNHDHIKNLIINYLNNNDRRKTLSKDFKKHYEKWPDGTYRNIKKDYDGTKMAGLFIPPNYKLTNSKKELILFLKEIAETLGPAYRSNFQDTYFTTPENMMVIFWPEVPNWTMDMHKNFKMTEEEYVWIADSKHNPKREMVWTGLFYDKVGKIWMSSAETPVYKGNEHLVTIGHDLMLSELLERAQFDSLLGAHNVIFRKDGRLILHPDKIKELKDSDGYYDINNSKDNNLMFLKDIILKTNKTSGYVGHNLNGDLVAFAKIEGPNWYFATVYPRSLITSTALSTIFYIIIIAFISLISEVTLLWFVIKKEISVPLNTLINAANNVKDGNFQTEIIVKRNDEFGTFAQTFNSMSKAVVDRDKKIRDHAYSLEQKVEQRTIELDQQRAIVVESAKLASLGEMAGGIAHEINNPLTIISGSVSLILKYAKKGTFDYDKLDKHVDRVNSTVKRIENIINGLRTFARTGDNDKIRKESLLEIVNETVSLCEHKIKMLEIDLKVVIDSSIFIHCRRVPLSQVLLNLISNAADSISNQNDAKWIQISSSIIDTNLYVFIEDSGEGVPEEVQKKIFQPFFTTKDIGHGTGLGLSISTGIIEGHNGKLYIDNERENTCFVIKMPIICEK